MVMLRWMGLKCPEINPNIAMWQPPLRNAKLILMGRSLDLHCNIKRYQSKGVGYIPKPNALP